MLMNNYYQQNINLLPLEQSENLKKMLLTHYPAGISPFSKR